MPIGMFTLPKVVMQLMDVIADDGAHTRKASNVIIGRLPGAKQIPYWNNCSP